MTSIRRQLTWRLLAVFVAPIALGAGAAFFIVRHSLVEQLDATLIARAGAIASITRERGDRITQESDSRFMRRFEGRDDLESRSRDDDDDDDAAFFEMWRADGAVVARSGSLGGADLPVLANASTERRRAWDVTLPNGRTARAVALRFLPRAGGDPPASVRQPLTLVVAATRSEIDRTLRTLALVLGGCGAVLLATVSFVVPRMLRRGLGPVDRVADHAASITPESLSARFPDENTPSELVPIVGRLNDLLARLERAFDRERQFTGDVAHELRTPIAELRSLAEVALKWPDTRPPETDQETLAIAMQLEGLVTRLLALLRSERGQLPLDPQPVSLSKEVESAWLPFVERSRNRRLRTSIEAAPNASPETDPVLLRSILTNLYDNACEYTPENGALTVVAERIDGGWRVRVTNDVSDLNASDLPQLFDRFWRQDSARATGEHSGLGLSLARAFARAIGADLTARLEDGRLTMDLRGQDVRTGATT